LAIPDGHPAIAPLSGLFGDHTFFLDGNGLNIVEPANDASHEARVVNLANWSDANRTRLAPHEPKTTEAIVALGPAQ
jgi:hypothetical protein